MDLPENLVAVGRESEAHPAFSNGIKLKSCRNTDARDNERHGDYTHYNPVKHGQVTKWRIGLIQASIDKFEAVFITFNGRQMMTIGVWR